MNAINQLSDILDVEILQKIQDDFAAIFNIPALIFDVKGNPITKPSNFTDFCKYVRSFELGEQICIETDKKIVQASAKKKQPCITQICGIKNIVSATAPIIVHEKHIATFGIGQILNGPVDINNIRQFAEKIGANAEILYEKSKSLAHADKDKLKQITNFLNFTVNQICKLAYKNLENETLIFELKKQKEQLSAAKKQAEDNENLKDLILSSTREMFAFYNAEMKIVWTNKAMSYFLGNAHEIKKGSYCYDAFFKRDLPCKDCVMEKVKTTGKPAEQKMTAPNNRQWLVRGYPVYDRNRKLTNFVEFIQDITETETAQKQLHFQSTLLNGINDFITATDLEGNITYANEKVKQLFGLQKLSGQNNVEMFGESPKEGATQKEIIEQTLERGEWRGQVVNFDKSGNKIYLDSRTQLLKNAAGKAYGIIGISTDISQIKIYQAELERKNALLQFQNSKYRSINEQLNISIKELKETSTKLTLAKQKAEAADNLKTAFLNNISHELRTPMNGILGFTEMLTNTDNDDAQKKQYYTNLINESCERLLNMVNDTVEISQVQAKDIEFQSEALNLKYLLEKVYRETKSKIKKKQLEFTLDIRCQGESMEITGDAHKILRSLQHVVDNAVKFTESGSVNILCRKKSDFFEIIVKDTGIGIQAEIQNVIFEPFRQAESQLNRTFSGNGIGLALVKSYIEMSGGKVQLHSQKGKGTTVTLSVPRNAQSVN